MNKTRRKRERSCLAGKILLKLERVLEMYRVP